MKDIFSFVPEPFTEFLILAVKYSEGQIFAYKTVFINFLILKENSSSITFIIVFPYSLWYSLAIVINSHGEQLPIYLLKVCSSVPNFISPTLYNSSHIFLHFSISNSSFLLLLHCSKVTNNFLKSPEVSIFTSSSKSLPNKF